MKKILFFILLSVFAQSQIITFQGCVPLFDAQDFVFNKAGADGTGRGIYITTPVDGQACNGLGSCEFKLLWNDSASRWELLADEGAGTFTTPYVMFYNETVTAQKPPSLKVGTWVENISVTNSVCGGNLSSTNAKLIGDLQDTVLNTVDFTKSEMMIFPNPVENFLNIKGNFVIKSLEVFSASGDLVKSYTGNLNKINLSNLNAGVYVLKINTLNETKSVKFIKK